MKCPKCDTPLEVTHSAIDAERLTFTLEFEGDMVLARTVGGCLVDIDKLLRAEARSLGLHDTVASLTAISLESHKLTVGLMVTHRTKRSRRERRAAEKGKT